MLSGIDISDNNGPIDFRRVARSGVQLVICKANEELRTDTRLAEYYPAIEAAGIACLGLYCFARPDLGSGAEQARDFLAAVGSVGGPRPGTRYALDLEEHGGSAPQIDAHADLRAWALDWASVVWPVQSRKDNQLKPLLYSRTLYLADHNLIDLADTFDLWLAAWGVPTPPPTPSGWTSVALHQIGGMAVAGIAGNVDIDVFPGTAYDWLSKSWGYQPDPLASKTTMGTPDIDGDVLTIISHVQTLVQTVNADIALARTKFGLQGGP